MVGPLKFGDLFCGNRQQCRRDVGEANERAQVWRMKVVDEQRQHKHIAAEARAVLFWSFAQMDQSYSALIITANISGSSVRCTCTMHPRKALSCYPILLPCRPIFDVLIVDVSAHLTLALNSWPP